MPLRSIISVNMQSLSNDERREVLGEVLSDELKVILEYVQEIPDIKHKLYEIDDRLTKVEDRLIVIEHVVKAHDADIKYLMHALT